MKKLAMMLFVSFMAVSAGAANWVAADQYSEKGLYNYVDTESISTQGKYKQAFTKSINIPEGYYLITLSSYDCKSNPRRIKYTHMTMFDLEGNVTASSAMTNSSFAPVLPDSIGESEVNMICNF